MDNKTPTEREAAIRAKAAQRQREAAVLADRENRQAFLRGYWAGMCRRNCWTYDQRDGDDVRLQVSPRRLSWRALVEMARAAESFRRAQYAHLEGAARLLAACPIAEHAHVRAWHRLGEAFGVSRDLLTDAFLKLPLGEAGATLQAAAFDCSRAGLYAIPRERLVELDSHYIDAYGNTRA